MGSSDSSLIVSRRRAALDQVIVRFCEIQIYGPLDLFGGEFLSGIIQGLMGVAKNFFCFIV